MSSIANLNENSGKYYKKFNKLNLKQQQNKQNSNQLE